MKFKSNLLNAIVTGIEDYNTLKIDVAAERTQILRDYKPEVATEKIQEIIAENKDQEDKYYRRIELAYNRDKNNIDNSIRKQLDGKLITEDLNLLNDNFELTKEELQILFDRYKDNMLMSRAIVNYANKKDMLLNIDIIDSKDRYKALEEAYNTSKGAINGDYNMSIDIVIEELFPKLDDRMFYTGA